MLTFVDEMFAPASSRGIMLDGHGTTYPFSVRKPVLPSRYNLDKCHEPLG